MSYRVFVKKGCGTCRSVVSIMKSKGLNFSEVDVSTDAGLSLARQLGVMHSGAVVDENNRILSLDEVLKLGAEPAMA